MGQGISLKNLRIPVDRPLVQLSIPRGFAPSGHGILICFVGIVSTRTASSTIDLVVANRRPSHDACHCTHFLGVCLCTLSIDARSHSTTRGAEELRAQTARAYALLFHSFVRFGYILHFLLLLCSSLWCAFFARFVRHIFHYVYFFARKYYLFPICVLWDIRIDGTKQIKAGSKAPTIGDADAESRRALLQLQYRRRTCYNGVCAQSTQQQPHRGTLGRHHCK